MAPFQRAIITGGYWMGEQKETEKKAVEGVNLNDLLCFLITGDRNGRYL